MSDAYARLRNVSLFDGLSDEDLERICVEVTDVHLEPGDQLFAEGDPGDRAYVITDGDVEILKSTARRDVLLALRRSGEVIGEMALIEEEPRIASARARSAADLIAIPKSSLDELLDTSPRAARAIFNTFLERLRATNDQLRQSERMAQLGTLTAGVAHELNNPAAAVARAADLLGERVDQLVGIASSDTDPKVRAAAMALLGRADKGPASALDRSDAEDELEDWLTSHDVQNAWELAPGLVDAGITGDDLEPIAAIGSVADFSASVRALGTMATVRRIAKEIGEASSRMSTIVAGLKSYSFLDQAPVQDVDVHEGLDATLALLAHKARHVRVVKEYAEALPTITALGTELNQVWTNLIDNACDALEEVEDPTVTIRTRRDDAMVVVEVSDNGPGIPEENQDKVFDSFFTTKPPGKGTGLGLQISWRVVVLEHRGDLTVSSRPGETTFTVTLPIDQQDPAKESA